MPFFGTKEAADPSRVQEWKCGRAPLVVPPGLPHRNARVSYTVKRAVRTPVPRFRCVEPLSDLDEQLFQHEETRDEPGSKELVRTSAVMTGIVSPGADTQSRALDKKPLR